MRNYSQLTLEQRYGIYTLLKTGHKQSKIAEVIGVHKSTISREVKRNRGKRGYRHKQAIVSLTERKSGSALLYKVEQCTKEATEKVMKQLLCPEVSGWSAYDYL